MGQEKIIILIICLGGLITLFALGFKFFAPLFELKEKNNHEYAMKRLIRDDVLDYEDLQREIKGLQQRQDKFAEFYTDLNRRVNVLEDNNIVDVKDLVNNLNNKINDELEDILERQEKVELKVFNGINVDAKPKQVFDFIESENVTNEDIDCDEIATKLD